MEEEVKLPDNQPIFHISAAAKLLGISIPTLRMYEKEGLVLPHKTKSNQRIYSKQDIDRIQCIRRAIKEKGISINGIKVIYSLIPCWDIIKCSDDDRGNCGAYNGGEKPCWTFNHPDTTCEHKDCRDCDVYLNYSQCGKIKILLQNITD